jgi:hypothetical protein
MSQDFYVMGAKVTGVEGEAETMYTDSFKDYI